MLRVASYYRSRGLNLSCFFVEQQAKSFERLLGVMRGYQARGVEAHAHQGEVDDVLDDVVSRATGVPLFLFLDPCGLCLPMERLADALARRRPQRRPATELLMNFSMMAVRRLGGHVRSPKGNEKSLERFDAVCGGRWWRDHFTGGGAEEDAAETVAAEYARRLKQRTGMFVHSVPVAKHRRGNPFITWSSRLVARTACECSATRSPGPVPNGGRRWNCRRSRKTLMPCSLRPRCCARTLL
ncbi:three-Cys-motif partner protein TcmP [Streptomyces sp. NPDC057623]|uniref:three-Cys-motif partner protein TcmP n=1 Tax=Streptomyces sp. NPDC057623 TaxID=3346187 RepID=UPI0036A1069A